tara:strand:+ start:328 stop:744 length:417 start_codon:yes stop_codon:yes gene_type:complete
MGIDCYNQTAQDLNGNDSGQGFDITAGDKGYLREAYHGEPYGTIHLLEECFEIERVYGGLSGQDEGVAYDIKVFIPAKLLRKRLPRTLELVAERYKKIYKDATDKEIKVAQKSFIDFVELAEKIEKREGKSCEFYASF